MKLADVQLTNDEVDSIYTARNWRNSIIHYEFSFSVVTAKAVFARLFGFLADFCRTELGQELQHILPEDLWNAALDIELYFEELSKRASERIQREETDSEWIWTCRYCGRDRFIVQDGINTCYLCGHWEEVGICEECDEPVYTDDLEAIYIGNYKRRDAWVHVCKFCMRDRLEREKEARYFGKHNLEIAN